MVGAIELGIGRSLDITNLKSNDRAVDGSAFASRKSSVPSYLSRFDGRSKVFYLNA